VVETTDRLGNVAEKISRYVWMLTKTELFCVREQQVRLLSGVSAAARGILLQCGWRPTSACECYPEGGNSERSDEAIPVHQGRQTSPLRFPYVNCGVLWRVRQG